MNNVNLVGRLTKDPDVKYTEKGKTVTRFMLAINSYGKEKKQYTEYIPCVAFDGAAETLGNYAAKGSELSIEGRIKNSSYEKNGERRYSTSVIIEKFKFCGSKKAA